MDVPNRLVALRRFLEAEGLQAYVVPSTDPHGSEYVADCWQRRRFLSGFDGSAGTLVVGRTEAGLWTDSRYFLQAERQLQGSGIGLQRMGEPGVPEIEDWLAGRLTEGERVGYDPAVFSAASAEALRAALSRSGVELVQVETDLVERVWGTERPALPGAPLRLHPAQFASAAAADKLARVVLELRQAGCHAMLVSALDEIAWLLNLRGADVSFNPVFIAFALVTTEGARLFVDPDKVGSQVRAALPEVRFEPYGALDAALDELGRARQRVWFDPATSNDRCLQRLRAAGAEVLQRPSPLPAWKAVKGEAELAGMRAAHRRDALALVRFLCWLESEALPAGGQTERSLAEALERQRARAPEYLGPSFETICAFGPHGAIVHYRVTEESDVQVSAPGILLLDSGGQYQDGTTDVTRTLALGEPSAEQRRVYTTVLRAHLLLSRMRFPAGSNGYQLDALGRAPLWAEGLNFGHGTGHGVGSALCVHEGPFSVSPRRNLTPLEPGHVLSIEPGFYRPDGFGVRVENLVRVIDCGQTESGRFLGFEPLTMCPYERGLIDPTLLDPVDREQIDGYHDRVWRELSDGLEAYERQWLRQATRPLDGAETTASRGNRWVCTR